MSKPEINVDFGFNPIEILKQIESLPDTSSEKLAIIMLDLLIAIFCFLEYAVRHDRSKHKPTATERPPSGPCCAPCSAHSGPCARDALPTKEELIYRAAIAGLCAPVVYLAVDIAEITTIEDWYVVVVVNAVVAMVYGGWAAVGAVRRRKGLKVLKEGFPDLEMGEDGRVKGT